MEKINIAKLLKDCPKGMELDCTLYEDVTLFCASDSGAYPIKIETPDGLVLLDKYGCYSSNNFAKCIIFPKGKTTWKGFVPPCKFDITTLVPLDSRVLVRDCNCDEWEGDIFTRYDNKSFDNFFFVTLGGSSWKQCIPYEGNEHLLGTTNDCDEFYKTWG